MLSLNIYAYVVAAWQLDGYEFMNTDMPLSIYINMYTVHMWQRALSKARQFIN